MLRKYKTTRMSRVEGKHGVQRYEQSDEESCHDKSMEQQESFINEGIPSRDVTQSSVSMSEGEADRDLEGMAGRVAKLEELLQGKEAIVEALHAEIDHLREESSSPNSSQSHNSSMHSVDIISLYQIKLQEFEKAINQRDNLIEELTSSLKQALSARDSLVAQLTDLNSMQLSPSNAENNMNLQEQIDVLETTLSNQTTTIQKLNSQLAQIRDHVQTLELEKETRNAEINDYKVQINNLNEQIRLGAAERNLNISEMLKQQKQYEVRVDKIKQDMQHILEKFSYETEANSASHQAEIKDLVTRHESELATIHVKYEKNLQSLKEENKLLADRLNKELPDLESKHAKELTVFQTQLAQCKKTIETLKLELVNYSESQQTSQAEVNSYKSKFEEYQMQIESLLREKESYEQEKELLNGQIKLHQVQLRDITSKHMAVTTVFESKESIERSLEEALLNSAILKDENEKLKFDLDDLSSRYSVAQSLIESNQVHERTLSTRIHDLEKSLSRFSGISASMFSEFNETTYQAFDDVTVKYQLTREKLEEKARMEKKLVEKIDNLEEDARKTKEDLEQANLTKRSYEKQLKDMKNMCDKLETEVTSLKSAQLENIDNTNVDDLTRQIESYEEEIKGLKIIIEQKDAETVNYVKTIDKLTETVMQSETDYEKLKQGLTNAWAQCSEVSGRFNETLATNDSKIDTSLPIADYCAALIKQFKVHMNIDESMNNSICMEDDKQYNNREEDITQSERMKCLQVEIASVTEENESLLKEMEELLEKQSNYDEILNKMHHYSALYEKLEFEKQAVLDENKRMKIENEQVNLLRNSLEQLKVENERLRKEIKESTERYKCEVNAIKADSAKDMKKMQSLLLDMREGNIDVSDLKAELETRHAKEMEVLRTYFEQKCLQMEKQYSEEIFSQQSKKMSDNDSEIEELTDDLYFGGGGDCLNIANVSESQPKIGVVPDDTQNKRNVEEEASFPHAEYEISIKTLQEQLENKVLELQNVKENYEQMLENQKKQYEIEIQNIKERSKFTSISRMVDQLCQTDWDTSALENGELSKLRAAYSRQLEEQVSLARHDIINALQEQIQALLSVDTDEDDNWPPELLKLRDKFTSNAKQEIQKLQDLHSAELLHLKEEHTRNTTRMIERQKQEISKLKTCSCNKIQNTDGFLSLENNVIVERDNLREICVTLKDLVGQLIKYFAVCEEEVNNTLINEVLKRQTFPLCSSKDPQMDEHEMLKMDTVMEPKSPNDTSLNSSELKIKRVHFAPQANEIVSIINSDSDILQSMMNRTTDITEKLRNELNNCLHRLKSESAEILGISLSPEENNFLTLSREIMQMKKVNEELNIKLSHAEALILVYQEESEQLKTNIMQLQQKLISAENKKEIIAEGYGEHDEAGGDITLQNFSQLQEKARHVLSNGGGDCSYLLQIIEELCKQSDKLMDDTRKEKEDLQQQIEAADKQLRDTRKFLEEQALERESERDESAKQIHYLQEQLKEREREKERDFHITSESSLLPESSSDIPVLRTIDVDTKIEVLESQIREMSSLVSDVKGEKSKIENELKAAVEKIWTLRDVIADLERQLQKKIEKEESLELQITQLETLIAAQTKNQQELVQELDSIKTTGENGQLTEHISNLQEELRKHKLSSEHFSVNSSALKQMKVELRDIQSQIDKRIKNLECVHMCDSNLSLSNPSEDVSIREQIDDTRCTTPDDPTSPPMLPLDQILKLKEKMLKHSRAEEVTLKRIKDLELQSVTLKNQNELLQHEQEILQQTISKQVLQIETMRGRLEQHKQSAPFVHRQATTKLELELHEANTKFQTLERIIADKELELTDIKAQLERTNKLLSEKEAEITHIIQKENTTVQKLKNHLEVLEEEKKILQSKVQSQEQAQLEIPQLIDSMLADKNEEIDHLKEQLSKKEKQLDIYSSLGIDETQLREQIKQPETKNSARTLSDILSIHSECEDVSEAIRAGPNLTNTIPHNISNLKMSTPVLSKDKLDTSTTPLPQINNITVQVPPLNLDSYSQSLQSGCDQNSQESCEIDLLDNQSGSKPSSPEPDVSQTANNIAPYVGSKQRDANNVDKMHNFAKKETLLSGNLSDKEEIILTGSQNDKGDEVLIKSNNETVALHIQSLENQLDAIKKELDEKSLMLNKREAELDNLQKLYKDIQIEFKETIDTLSRDNCFYKSQYETAQVSENKIKKDLEQVENTLKLKVEELQEHRNKMQTNEKIIMELHSENSRLKESMDEREEEHINKYSNMLQEKMQELQNMKDILLEKDIVIETIQTRNIEIEGENKQLYESKTKCQIYKQELMQYQNEIQRLTDGLKNRDQIIKRLEEMARRSSISGTSSPSDCKNQEIYHLQEYLKEKDKVIRQMSDDSKSLHKALETIQNKMKESGNVVELRKKLKEERKINVELKMVVEKLRVELQGLKETSARCLQDDTDIEDMVQRELNLSATLDRQIMNAIDSDSEENIMEVEKQKHPSPHVKQLDADQSERVVSMSKYDDLKLQLKQATKVSEGLLKLKDDLEIEREMLKCQINEYENRIFQIKSDLAKESGKLIHLEEELSSEKNTVRTLKIQMDKEKQSMQLIHTQDVELIQFLQTKLKSSFEIEEKLRSEISLIRQEHKNLEVQLSSMREHIQSQNIDNLPRLTDLLETEKKKYISLVEEYEKEQKNSAELTNTLKKIDLERNRYKKQSEINMEKQETLVSRLVLVEEINEQLKTDLRRIKEELKEKEDECEWLQKRIKTMLDAEIKRQEQRTNNHDEIKGLRREINNAREVMMDLETNIKRSERELTESRERESKLEKFLEILKENEGDLKEKLNAAKDEEKKSKELISVLQQQLKETLIRGKPDSAKCINTIKELIDSNEKYSKEKEILHAKLIRARQDKDQLKQRIKFLETQMQQTELLQTTSTKHLEKIQHFYGKFLKSDSRRKALLYQKQYLLCVVSSYQYLEENTLAMLARLTDTQRSYTKTDRRKSVIMRFKRAGLVIVSIHRMKWLILRWRTGRCVGANALIGSTDQLPANMRKFTSNHSPPVREKVEKMSGGDVGHSGHSFERCCQRIKNIEQKLSLAMAEPGTDQVSSTVCSE